MDNRLLGIAKKAGLLEIGDDSVGQAARSKKARVILSASDASEGSKRRARGYAEACGSIHLVLPSTKEELSLIVGRGSPGMLTILDAGIAAKYVSMLASGDPEQYGEAAGRLAVKAERVLQRRKETLAHKRNKRTGKRRTTQ
ncbi:MAG: 50S ribosomal protein L7 [Clostridiales bacterium]|nr:50S ribosomal protein L7 [Clostridiales bacterium]